MQLYRKVQAVEKVFRALGRHAARFQAAAGLACIEGCGDCCDNERIEASPLEFLPLAYRLYRRGRAEELLAVLAADPGPTCVFLERARSGAAPGRCTVHADRGLICRLFGFSGVVDRGGAVRYATCRPLKERDPARFAAADAAVRDGRIDIPIGPRYHAMLQGIDPALMAYRPLNTAIRKAIEEVLGHYAYRRRPG